MVRHFVDVKNFIHTQNCHFSAYSTLFYTYLISVDLFQETDFLYVCLEMIAHFFLTLLGTQNFFNVVFTLQIVVMPILR